MPGIFSIDAYSPQQIAERVNEVRVVKALLSLLTLWMLSIWRAHCISPCRRARAFGFAASLVPGG